MSDAAHQARRSRKLMGVVLAAVVALVVPLTVVSSAQGAPGGGGKATQIVFTSVLPADVVLPTTPGTAGLSYAVQDEDVLVSLEFRDKQGRPAPVDPTTSVDVSILKPDGAEIGRSTVDPTESALDIRISVAPEEAGFFNEPALDVVLTARAHTSPKDVEGTSAPFDILVDSNVVQGDLTQIGGVDQETDDGCAPSQESSPVCADLLPYSDFEGTGQLGLGLCASPDETTTTTSSRGKPAPELVDCRGNYVQALTAFKTGPGIAAPATLRMKCDKSLCGGGSLQAQQLTVTLSPDPDSDYADTWTAPACPSKGVVQFDAADLPIHKDNLPFCVDYVQSTRDNAGDTILYFLFVVDAKVRFS